MPFLNIHTNLPLEGIKKERFLEEALNFLAEELQKPRERIIVNYMYNPDILFGSNRKDFGALIELKAIGFPEHRAKLAADMTNFIYKELEVDFEHIEIEFIDMPPSTLSIAGRMSIAPATAD